MKEEESVSNLGRGSKVGSVSRVVINKCDTDAEVLM